MLSRFSAVESFLALILIFLVFLPQKLYRFNSPIDDNHIISQVTRYSVILRMYVGEGSILKPTIYQSINYEDAEFLHMVEFPIYQAFISTLFLITGESLVIARSVNILLTFLATIGIFIIGQKLHDSLTGYFAAISFNFFPIVTFYSRAIVPDVLALTAYIFALVISLHLRQDKSLRHFVLLGLLLAIAVLTKPFYFIFLPICFFIIYSRQHLKTFIKIVCAMLIPVAAVVLWRYWILRFPDASWMIRYHTDGLLHGYVGYMQFYKIMMWHVVFFQRDFFGHILTLGGGLAVCATAFSSTQWKEKWKSIFVLGSAIASLVITFAVAYGSYWHDYYMFHWMPLASVSVGLCFSYLFHRIVRTVQDVQKAENSSVRFKKAVPAFLISLGVLIVGIVSWNQRQVALNAMFHPGSAWSTEAHYSDFQKVQNIIDKNATVVTITLNDDPLALMQLRRRGYVVSYMAESSCRSATELLDQVKDVDRQVHPNFILLDIDSDENKRCNVAEYHRVFDENYNLVLLTNHVAVFHINWSLIQ